MTRGEGVKRSEMFADVIYGSPLSSRDGTNIIPKSDRETSVNDRSVCRSRSVGRQPYILSIGAHNGRWVLSGEEEGLSFYIQCVTSGRGLPLVDIKLKV